MIPLHVDKGLDIAQLVLYIPLLLLSQYCLFRHGKHGFLGWFFVGAFCLIRLIAAGLKIHADTSGTQSTGALIVDNIGLSPVILAALGLLHEARIARGSVRDGKIEWLFVLLIHILVSTALALVAVGVSSSISSTKTSHDSSMSLLKAGFAMMFVGWGIIVGWSLWSIRRPASYGLGDSNLFRDGTILLNAVLFSLPFILLRAIYGAINLFGSGDNIGTSSFSSNVAADVIMNVLAQLIAAIIFVVAGIRTAKLGAGISRVSKEQGHAL